MPNFRPPGPLCQIMNPMDMDAGTLALTQSALPGPLLWGDVKAITGRIPARVSQKDQHRGRKHHVPRMNMAQAMKFLHRLQKDAVFDGVPLARFRQISPGLSPDAFAEIMPQFHARKKSPVSAYLQGLNASMVEFEINTYLRQACYLGQVCLESAELRFMHEIADGWAYDISRNPRKAKELGNVDKGDGPKYKGRGPIQVTGRNNYRAAGKALGLDLEGDPDQAADPATAFRISAWFWKGHGLNELADAADVVQISRVINVGEGGRIKAIRHLDRRIDYFKRALAAFKSAVSPEP
jgi:predicted chitinase